MRFVSSDGEIVFGRVEGGYLHEYESLDQRVPTGEVLSMRALTRLAPCAPGKIVALWNNYHYMLQSMLHTFLLHLYSITYENSQDYNAFIKWLNSQD